MHVMKPSGVWKKTVMRNTEGSKCPNSSERGVCFQYPPVRATGERALLSDIHNFVAKSRKQTRRQRLGEEIGQVIGATHCGRLPHQ
eukprot:5252272-Pleurochrysis_carterae.AAC.1